jgi:ankyrin repeat protein
MMSETLSPFALIGACTDDNRLELVQSLIASAADVNIAMDNGLTALHAAAFNNAPACVKVAMARTCSDCPF